MRTFTQAINSRRLSGMDVSIRGTVSAWKCSVGFRFRTVVFYAFLECGFEVSVDVLGCPSFACRLVRKVLVGFAGGFVDGFAGGFSADTCRIFFPFL